MSNVQGGSAWIGEQRPPREEDTTDAKSKGRTWWRPAPTCPCPVCKHDTWCLVRPTEVICMRAASGVPVDCGRAGKGYWHPLTPGAAKEGVDKEPLGRDWKWDGEDQLPGPVTAIPVVPVIPRSALDRVYRAMLDVLGLSQTHRAQLKERGLKDTAIASHLYGSLEHPNRESAAGEIMRRLGRNDLAGIPGFRLRQRGTGPMAWSIGGFSGLLVPCQDEDGLIAALQIRIDKAGTGGKYRFFSTPPNRTKNVGGTKTSPIAHVAIPEGVDPTQGQLWVTEGGLKANVASEFLRRPVLGVPGVGSWGLIFDSASRLLARPRQIVVAYDMDKRTKKVVADNEISLISELQRRGHTVQVADWDVDADGKPKGIDNLLANGGQYRLHEPHQTMIGRDRQRTKVCVPPAWLDEAPGTMEVDRASDYLRDFMHGMIKGSTQVQGALIIRADPFGVGKTSSTVRALKDLIRTGWPKAGSRPLRVAFLVDSSQEHEGGGTVAKGKNLARNVGSAAVYIEGRNDRNCGRVNETKAVGVAGHDVMRTICIGCRDHYENLRGNYGVTIPSFIRLQSRSRDICPYLQQQTAARRCPIRFMHKSSVLNESKKVEEYDVVIVDEDLSGALLRTVPLKAEDLVTWEDALKRIHSEKTAARQELGRQLRASTSASERAEITKATLKQVLRCASLKEHLKLVGLLRQALQRLVPGGRRTKARPLVEVLVELLGTGGKAKDLIRRCVVGPYRELPDKGYYPHEEPRAATGGRLSVRAYLELLNALLDEVVNPSGDHRVHVVSGTPQNSIELRFPRLQLIASLQKRMVISLDATPNSDLLKRLFGNRMHEERLPVPEKVHVLHLIDGLYGKPEACKALPSRLIEIVSMILKPPLIGKIGVLAHKATLLHLKWLDPQTSQRLPGALKDENGKEISGSDSLVIGYWGRDERATNIFEKCEVLIVSGLHMPPIDVVERDVQAWRRVTRQPRPEQSQETMIYRPYGYRDQWGHGRAYHCPMQPDPDVDAALVRIWSANLRQAIGRLRATRSDHAKVVFVDTAMPAQHVPVFDLVTLKEATEQPAALMEQARSLRDDRDLRLAKLLEVARPIHSRLLSVGMRVSGTLLRATMGEAGVTISEWDARLIMKELQ